MARRPKLTTIKPDWARTLEVRRIKLGLSQEIAAESGNLSQPYFSEIERGERELTTLTHSKLRGLAQALQWTLADLQKATGIDLGVVTAWTIAGSDGPSAQPLQGHRIPVLKLSEAATPATDIYDDRIIDWAFLSPAEYRAHMLCLEVDGESMSKGETDGLHSGDRLYIDTRDMDLQEGKVYVIHVHGNGVVVKRARLLGADWWLFSDNSSFQPTKPDEATIIGRVFFHQPRGKRL